MAHRVHEQIVVELLHEELVLETGGRTPQVFQDLGEVHEVALLLKGYELQGEFSRLLKYHEHDLERAVEVDNDRNWLAWIDLLRELFNSLA